MEQDSLSEQKEERMARSQRKTHLASDSSDLLRTVLVHTINEGVSTEGITSVHRSPDIWGEGIAQMPFETCDRLLPQYFAAVITGVIGEKIRVGVAVEHPIVIWSERVRNGYFRLE